MMKKNLVFRKFFVKNIFTIWFNYKTFRKWSCS